MAEPLPDEVMEEIGRLVDQASNVIAASSLPLDAKIHVEGMRSGLAEIRESLRAIYTSHGGKDWWDDG